MKNLFRILFITAVSLSASAQEISSTTGKDFHKLKWLEGTWIRINAKPGRTAHERWEKVSDTGLRGWGVNLKGQDTLFVERISIVVKNDALFYVADVPENKKPVFFRFIQITDYGFVCENPEHDFPKKINYQNDGNTLKATISGDGKSIEYLFERK